MSTTEQQDPRVAEAEKKLEELKNQKVISTYPAISVPCGQVQQYRAAVSKFSCLSSLLICNLFSFKNLYQAERNQAYYNRSE